MADDALPPLPKPKHLGLIQPQPLNYQRVSQDNDTEKNKQEETDLSPTPANTRQPDSTIPGKQRMPDGQKQQYTAPTGYSRLGIDIQTGRYVDVPQASRRQGLYIIGIQGYGKSGLIENLIIQDIKQQIGVCVLDPHGELIDNIIARLPDREKEKKVILLDLTEKGFFFGLNLFDCTDPADDSAIMETLSQVMHVFEKSHGIVPTTPLMYDLLFNSAYVLIANPGYTMIDIRLLLTSKACRERLLQKVVHPDVRGFWESWDDPKLTPPQEQEKERKSILNKLNDFSHAPLRYIVGQSHSTINLQEIMDSGKILLVKLERKREQATSLIGSILVALILNASESRKTHKLFNLYADEFQNFATEDFALLLEQARKKDIGVTMAHQNRGQLELSEKQADANLKKRTLSVGSLIVFRVPTDANELAGQFPQEPEKAWEEEFEAERLEVREPERIETIDVIDGDEPKKVYKRQVVDHLLKQGHEDERVMQFVRTYLQPLSLAVQKNTSTWYGSSAQRYTAQQAFIDLNTWLYEGMVNPDNLFQPFPQSVFGLLRLDTSLLFNKNDMEPFYNFWYCLRLSNNGEVKAATEEWQEEYMFMIKLLRARVQAELPQKSEDFYTLRRSLFLHPQLSTLYKDAVYKRTDYESEEKMNEVIYKWERDIKVSGWRNWGKIAGRDYGVEPHPYQSQSEFAKTLVTNMRMKYYLEINEAIMNGYVSFEYFSEAAQLCQYALWQNPLMTTDSGHYRPRKRQQIIVHPEKTFPHPRKAITHPQRTENDMVGEMARILTNLPLYTARAKFTTEDGLEEHTMRTLDPKQQREKPLFGQALQERIARIQTQNRTPATPGSLPYCRSRQGVEEEIRQRQERYSHVPQIPGKQAPQPPDDEPHITRRQRPQH